MEAVCTSVRRSNTFPIFAGVLLLLALVATVLFSLTSVPPTYPGNNQENRVKMEKKSSGRNGKHVNQKAKEVAEQKAEKVKEELDMMLKKPGVKTPKDKKIIQNLQDQLAHWRKKSKWSGENHSQKGKGN